MPLIGWSEIRKRAARFAKDFEGEAREHAEAKSFWDGFFQVFGVKRRLVAAFEHPVANRRDSTSFIDLLWRGTLIVEHKSRGKSLAKAHSQAVDYIQSLPREDAPRFILVSDFEKFELHDLESGEAHAFALRDLHRHVELFAFVAGYNRPSTRDDDPIDILAVELMGRLHDALEDGGYVGHALERHLTRVLFCLFADDTGIFERGAFDFLARNTREDGADLGPLLARVFETLDTPAERRQRGLDETVAALPFVNGGLFSERLPIADYVAETRGALLACSGFDWSRISPAIFGSLFQAVMEPRERRQVGGHYTSERDIMKVVKSLFLDGLRAELGRLRRNKAALKAFHERLGGLKFLDPACGCGNFLVVAYRELRLLEIDTLKALYGADGQRLADIALLTLVDVDAMHGIEIGEFPVRIAETALWLMDHQMNLRTSEEFGQYMVRLPLLKSAVIFHGNALTTDWNAVIPSGECDYVLGNPPFVGKHYRNADQRRDLAAVFKGVRGGSDLDYVSAWYHKAAEYARGTRVESAFVSTNSITQGEQVSILWPHLLAEFGVRINFAHRTFAWESEARGKAHVHVIIVGFSDKDAPVKRIHDYASDPDNPTVEETTNISPYLTAGSDTVVMKQQRPLSPVMEIRCGNKPSDGGYLVFDGEKKAAFLRKCPGARPWFRPYVGAEELLNGGDRHCLWLDGIDPEKLKSLPELARQVSDVKWWRERSPAAPTRDAAKTPTKFFFTSQPKCDYIAIPEVTSERRVYIPLAIMKPKIIASNKLYVLPTNDPYMFGMLQSAMHMAWIRHVAGRLNSRYQYSGTVVYNTFVWPEGASAGKRAAVAAAAGKVLDTRSKYPKATLATLYDPVTMPPDLVKAHGRLDKAVERCYRTEPFESDRDRVELLFELYEKVSSPLAPAEGSPRAMSPRRPRA